MKSYKCKNLSMWVSSDVPYISLFRDQQTCTVIVIFFSHTMHYTFQRVFHTALSMFPLLFNRLQSKAGVFNQFILVFTKGQPSTS